MKRYFAAVLLLIPVLFSGCFKQDLSLCGVDENLTLVFELTDGNSGILADKIDKLDIVLYNRESQFLERITVLKSDFSDQNKVRVTVEPGEYYVVAWGNVGDFSTINPNGSFATGYLETTSEMSGCPLYYGPRTTAKTKSGVASTRADDDIYYVKVPQGSKVEKEIKLVRAHRTVRVWLKGFEKLHTHDGVMPNVQLTNIPYKYDFYLNTDAARKNFQRGVEDSAEANSSVTLRRATFSAPIVDFEDPMMIYIKCGQTGDNLVDPISLKEFVENNTIADINDFDVLITAVADAQVTVTLPNWDEEEVKPNKH